MEKPDKYFKEVEKGLSSGKDSEILKTLKGIRVSGKAEIMPLVFNLLALKPSIEIQEEIFSILGQLKNQDCVPFVIEAIGSGLYEQYSVQLISSCWLSGLNYSEHLLVFAEQFVTANYQSAIEAFSVIEEWIHEAGHASVHSCKDYLINSLPLISQEKKPLYVELVKVVESYL